MDDGEGAKVIGANTDDDPEALYGTVDRFLVTCAATAGCTPRW